jgi:hypothetical protein
MAGAHPGSVPLDAVPLPTEDLESYGAGGPGGDLHDATRTGGALRWWVAKGLEVRDGAGEVRGRAAGARRLIEEALKLGAEDPLCARNGAGGAENERRTCVIRICAGAVRNDVLGEPGVTGTDAEQPVSRLEILSIPGVCRGRATNQAGKRQQEKQCVEHLFYLTGFDARGKQERSGFR